MANLILVEVLILVICISVKAAVVPPILHACTASPKIQIADGHLQGCTYLSVKGRQIDSFAGIPFAKPPIGERRFKAPVKNDPWNRTKLCNQDVPSCPQPIPTNPAGLLGQEDCLYLNVYTPKDRKKGAKMPVIFYMYGGVFFFGTASNTVFGPDYLLSKDVVLVVPNYRLGPLGFLGTEDCASPGNNGLKDLLLALDWTIENVAAFGGDPKTITIMGESAGAASVTAFITSKRATGKFQRAITESGSMFSDWSLALQPKKAAEGLAKFVKCPTANHTLMVDCLRKKSAQELTLFQVPEQLQWKISLFAPVVEPKNCKGDPAFLNSNPREDFKSGRFDKVPLLTGVNKDESIPFTEPVAVLTLTKQTLKPYIQKLTQADGAALTDLVNYLYDKYIFGGKTDPSWGLVRALTDVMFWGPNEEIVKAWTRHKTPVYEYLFNYTSGRPKDHVAGVPHFIETPYVLKVAGGVPTPIDADPMVDTMVKVWTSFAKTGVPTMPDDSQVPSSNSRTRHYIHFNEITKVLSGTLLQQFPRPQKYCTAKASRHNTFQLLFNPAYKCSSNDTATPRIVQ